MTIYLADDHPIILKGMQMLVETKKHTVVGTATNGITCFNELSQMEPDVAFLDISMPGLNGLEVAEKLIRQKVLTKIVILSMEKDESVVKRCKQIGVSAYLLKDFALQEIDACLEAISTGKTYFSKELEGSLERSSNAFDTGLLTPAERKILAMVGEKKSSKVIAEELFISEKTVEKHRSNIISKLNLPSDRASLIEAALLLRGKI